MHFPKLFQIYVEVSDFCKVFFADQVALLPPDSENKGKAVRKPNLDLKEVLTLVIAFHLSHSKNFKAFYRWEVLGTHRFWFPDAPSYPRFIALMKRALLPLFAFLLFRNSLSRLTGTYFLDSTHFDACKTHRYKKHRTLSAFATYGKTSVSWFFGIKLHLIINDFGEMVAFTLTAGNVDDRVPVLDLVRGLSGKIYADKGYIKNDLQEDLLKQNLLLITRLKKNMKNKLMSLKDKYLLQKRWLIETVFGLLKAVCNIGHSRHRSAAHYFVDLLAALIAYPFFDHKPSISFPNFLAH